MAWTAAALICGVFELILCTLDLNVGVDALTLAYCASDARQR